MLTLMYIFVLGSICTAKWTLPHLISTHLIHAIVEIIVELSATVDSKRGRPLTVYSVVSAAGIKLPKCNLHYILSGSERLEKRHAFTHLVIPMSETREKGRNGLSFRQNDRYMLEFCMY